MNGEVVGEITETAIVKVEEHGLAGPRSLDRNTSVEAMTIAMAIRPGKVGARRDRSRDAGSLRCTSPPVSSDEEDGSARANFLVVVRAVAALIPSRRI